MIVRIDAWGGSTVVRIYSGAIYWNVEHKENSSMGGRMRRVLNLFCVGGTCGESRGMIRAGAWNSEVWAGGKDL